MGEGPRSLAPGDGHPLVCTGGFDGTLPPGYSPCRSETLMDDTPIPLPLRVRVADAVLATFDVACVALIWLAVLVLATEPDTINYNMNAHNYPETP